MKKIWKLSCPAPECGQVADGVYNLGPVLMSDEFGTTPQDSKMQIVTEVNAEDFDGYIGKLKQSGVRPVFENETVLDRYFGFQLGENTFQVSYISKRNEIRVIEDTMVTPLDRFCYQSSGDKETTLYQYGLYYDPNNAVTDITVNCGMLYIIRLADNSLILIDGGHLYQWCEESLKALWNFLREITGTSEGEKIRISCWYFTHAHNDHMYAAFCLLDRYGDQMEVQRVMHGFASYQVKPLGYDTECESIKESIAKKYPDVQQFRVHTGQKLQFGDVTFDVLFAQEDAVEAEHPEVYPFHDFNCTSSVLRITINGKSLMLLGDTNVESEELITRISVPELWKADMVQIAHHCFNYLDTLYSWIQAPILLMPNSYHGSHTPENAPKLAGAVKYMKDENQIYYEGAGTDGFTASPEGFRAVYHAPLTGSPYDGCFGPLGTQKP